MINYIKELVLRYKKQISIVGIITLLAGIAEITGYSLRDLIGKEEVVEQTKESPVYKPSIQNVSTTGDQSPAIISKGSVDINYGEQKNDTTSEK